ncbi:DUF3846 domain-containing protein [Dactylosporangium sp. NPDC005572]|uniref:DUF3846 domain-containing protein n=1 Tax=Dactylosporangium sp. NPDC005572 TaxID=3156889 RepID=UPI0033AF948F
MAHTSFTFLVVAEDGTSHEHHTRLRTGAVGELLRRAVGGWLEPIPIGTSDLSVWCDEDGLSLRRRPNPAASLLVARLGGGQLPLVGPVVVTGRRGSTVVGLTADQVDALLAALTHGG